MTTGQPATKGRALVVAALVALVIGTACAGAAGPGAKASAGATPQALAAIGTASAPSPVGTILFTETWEDAWSQWDAGELPGVRERATATAHGGTHAVRLTYQAPNDRGPHGGSAKAYFTPTRELYFRWFMRFGVGFLVGFPETKLIGIFGPQYPTYWLRIFGGSPGGQRVEWCRQVTVAAQGAKEVSRPGALDTRNFHAPFAFKTERWYELEWHIKHNTPGKADGVVELWIDGRKVLDVQRARLAGDHPADTPPSAGTLDHLDLYRQFGVGQLYFDDLQVSTSRIGRTP